MFLLINRIKDADPALYADMVKYGRRNIDLLTLTRMKFSNWLCVSGMKLGPFVNPIFPAYFIHKYFWAQISKRGLSVGDLQTWYIQLCDKYC